MPTRPRHYAVFILNPDGSGTVKQFDTWQEAMTAYADSSNAGKAVYLYPQPAKAIGAGTTPIEAPAKTPVAFTPQQNTGQFAWPPSPPLPRPPVREPGSGGPFGPPSNYDAWMTYCTAHPTHRECTIPGKEKFGTVLSTICSVVEGATSTDDTGQPWPASIPQQIKADGLGGTFEAGPPPGAEYFDGPCQLPNGFQTYGDTIFIAPEIVIYTLKSTATAGPAFFGPAEVERQRELRMWNGSGGYEVVRMEHGFLDTTAAAYPFVELKPAEAGDSIYELDGTLIGTIDVVYPLMPSSDNHIEEVGTEVEDVMVNITQRGTTVKSGTRSADKFENKWPEMNPDSYVSNIGYDPDFGTGTGSWSITNKGTGAFDGVNFEWIPGTPADGRPPAGWAGYVKRDASGDFDRVDPPVPTPEGQTWLGEWVYDYYPNGTILDEDAENYYKADGLGSYYAESKNTTPCDPADTLVNDMGDEPIFANVGCGDWEVGRLYYSVYADGNCSYYSVTTGDSYTPSGQLLGKCGDNCYFTSGTGTPTSEPSVAEGQQIGEPVTSALTYDAGCGTWDIGTRSVVTLSNGDCTTREETTDTYNAGDIGTCSGYIYSVDSVGAVTSREDNTNPCADAGTEAGRSGNNDLMYDAGCGSIQIGYYQEVTMNDGSCGTYTYNENTSTPGDFTTCNGNIYTVDSTGGVTSRPECDPAGTNQGQDPNDSCNDVYADGTCGTYTNSNGSCPDCEDSALHTDGSEGWSYDGCNWSYDDNWNCDGAGTNLGVSGDPCYDLYADGNCGTYTSSNGSCDGGGGGGGGGGGCDSAGITVSTGLTADLYITTPCGEVAAGTRTYDVYTDGNCGTTESTTNEAWSSNGTELNSCSDSTQNCTYYADGNGSYTTSCTPIEPPPEECESDSLHVEGEDGWTYDGCHWTQAADWDEFFTDAGEPYNGTELMPETPEGGGNENGPPHEPGTGVAYDAQINSNGDWDVILV